MARIHKSLAQLVYRLRGTMTAEEVSISLGKDYRNFAARMERGEGFVLNDKFCDSLEALGYELVLQPIKKEGEKK